MVVPAVAIHFLVRTDQLEAVSQPPPMVILLRILTFLAGRLPLLILSERGIRLLLQLLQNPRCAKLPLSGMTIINE